MSIRRLWSLKTIKKGNIDVALEYLAKRKVQVLPLDGELQKLGCNRHTLMLSSYKRGVSNGFTELNARK